jgi:hypothetical protein
MIFELMGFVSGVAAIGTIWMLFLRHERGRVLQGFYTKGRQRRSAGNALIWPSR